MKSLLDSWSSSTRPERIAHAAGAAALVAGAAHVLAFFVVPDAVWSGAIGFRKTVMFGFSIGMTLLTLGWLLRYFPPRPRLQTAVIGVMSGSLLLEILIIALQRFRGVPSHFNMATVFDGILWSMMGLAIMIFALLAVLLAVFSFGRLHAPPAMATAIRAGMLLLVFSQISGQLIVLHGSSVVFQDGHFVAENIARAATIGPAGNLKLPHAISLHGIQVIPLLGLVIARLGWSTRRSRFWVGLSGAGYFGIAVLAQVQAYAGRSVTDLHATAAFVLAASVAAFGLPWLHAANVWLMRATRSRAPRGSVVTTGKVTP